MTEEGEHERECYKLVQLDVLAAEHGWQRVYESERSGALGAIEGKAEAGVWTRDLPDGRVVLVGITYALLDGADDWQALRARDGYVWHAIVGDGKHEWEIGWRSATSLPFWLQASGQEFLDRHAGRLQEPHQGRVNGHPHNGEVDG